MWLCEKHVTSMKATVLSDDASSSNQDNVREENLGMVTALREFDLEQLSNLQHQFSTTPLAKRDPGRCWVYMNLLFTMQSVCELVHSPKPESSKQPVGRLELFTK